MNIEPHDVSKAIVFLVGHNGVGSVLNALHDHVANEVPIEPSRARIAMLEINSHIAAARDVANDFGTYRRGE